MFRTTTIKTKDLSPFLTDFGDILEMFNVKPLLTSKEDFFTELPLPGVAKDEISIEVKNSTLIVRVELKEPKGFAKTYDGSDFSYFLSDKHDLDKIEAVMENGLLSIKIPLKKEDDDSVLKVKIK